MTDETGRGRLYGADPDGAKPGTTGSTDPGGEATRVGVERPGAQEQGAAEAWTPAPMARRETEPRAEREPDAEAEPAAAAGAEPRSKGGAAAERPRASEPAPREGERERPGFEARTEMTPTAASRAAAAAAAGGASTGASASSAGSDAADAADSTDLDWFRPEPRRGPGGGSEGSGSDSGRTDSGRSDSGRTDSGRSDSGRSDSGSGSGSSSSGSRDADSATTVLASAGSGSGTGGGGGSSSSSSSSDRGESGGRGRAADWPADFDMQSAPTSFIASAAAASAPSSPVSESPSASSASDETAVAPRIGGRRTDAPTVRSDDTWRPYGAASSADSLPTSQTPAQPPTKPMSPPSASSRRPDRETLRYEAPPTEMQGAWTPSGGTGVASGPQHGDETDVYPPAGDMAVRGPGRDPADDYRAAEEYGRSRHAVEGLSVSERMSRFERMSSPEGPAAGRWGDLPPGGRDEFDEYDGYDPDEPSMARRPAGPGSGSGGPGGKPRSRRRRGLLISGGVGAVVVVVAAVLALTGAVTLPGLAAKPVPTVGFSPNSAAAGSPADQTGDAFLNDWENGNIKAAANITDNPAAALTALKAYKSDLKLSGLTISPGSAGSAGWQTFGVTAQVGTPASPWTYNSGLAAYQGSSEGVTRWFVKWNPDLLFTDLKAGQHLGLGTVPATVTQVADVHGTPITSANAPSLTNIVNTIEKNSSGAGGTPGQMVQVMNAAGAVVSTVSTVSQPVSGGPAKSTFDLNIEAAAQQAASQAVNSSVVVIQPSTGDILAVANNPSSGQDTAMVGALAPGSTFKTITTTLLINKGLVSNLSQSVPCPGTLDAGGITLHNSEGESGAGNSFLDDFAASCNNAFSSFYNQVTTSDLAGAAQTYYAFNEQWDVGLGVPTTYGKVPDGSNNNIAEELVGQDQIQTSPLAMASVAATIATGTFHQPILVPGTKQITATALPSATDTDLKTLMHAVVTSGTLEGKFTNTDGVYAKTGTAEYGSQSQYNNSWTIAFKDDYAICALAVNGGFGADTAGPEVNTVLNAIDPN